MTSNGDGHLVPPAIAAGLEEARAAAQRDIMRAFGVEPWQVGLAPVPWRIRVWHKVTFARWRGRRMIARERAAGD